MAQSFKNDYTFGLSSEEEVINILSDFFNTKLKKDDDQFALFDFHNDDKTIFVELKTRRIEHDTYKTIMIGANKVQYAKQRTTIPISIESPTPSFNFCFRFTNGIYYVPYIEDEFNLYERKPFQRYGRNDHFDDTHDVIYIPSSSLKPIKK
jgi:hypothetical protein